MKFRRNVKQEKTFRTVAIVLLLLSISCLITSLITKSPAFMRLFAFGIPTSLLYCYVAYSQSRAYIEFQNDTIVLVNHIASNIEIHISDIEAVIMPSREALKKKLKDHEIFLKQSSGHHPISYSPDIEAFFLEHFDSKIVYYDHYNEVFNNKK
ncbi:MAG: hypothetical protein IKC63_08060 [Clostridia bacterium]|nr:hypothetical protein [Clostridia bacterium]